MLLAQAQGCSFADMLGHTLEYCEKAADPVSLRDQLLVPWHIFVSIWDLGPYGVSLTLLTIVFGFRFLRWLVSLVLGVVGAIAAVNVARSGRTARKVERETKAAAREERAREQIAQNPRGKRPMPWARAHNRMRSELKRAQEELPPPHDWPWVRDPSPYVRTTDPWAGQPPLDWTPPVPAMPAYQGAWAAQRPARWAGQPDPHARVALPDVTGFSCDSCGGVLERQPAAQEHDPLTGIPRVTRWRVVCTGKKARHGVGGRTPGCGVVWEG
jgi:hypothetical protein